jgi:hypothetical protein
MNKPLLYRRRFIPDELVELKDDRILSLDDHMIITKWTALHPRKDIAGGISAYYLDQGFKVSKVFNKENELVYWYCDIVQQKPGPNPDSIIFEDLLIDVILHPDGFVQILDLDELAQALEQKLIGPEEVSRALRTLDSLLKLIYQGQFPSLKEAVEKAETL